MPGTPLSIIEESIERSIFEAVREELVDKDLIPDITTYNLANDQLLWESDLKALRGTNIHKFVCEVFGVSGYQGNNTKKVPRVVIDTQQFFPGELGGDTTRFYQQANPGDPYSVARRQPRSADYYFNIHIVTNTAKQLRIIQALIALALPRRGYIKFHFEPVPTFSGNLFIENMAFTDHPQTVEGVMEKIYRFRIVDVWETECIVLATNIAPIDNITVTTKVDKGGDTPFTVS